VVADRRWPGRAVVVGGGGACISRARAPVIGDVALGIGIAPLAEVFPCYVKLRDGKGSTAVGGLG